MKKGDCTVRVAKTKALISCAVIAQLICVFAFAYAKVRFSSDAAQLYHHRKFNTYKQVQLNSLLASFFILAVKHASVVYILNAKKSCTTYIFAIFIQIENFN